MVDVGMRVKHEEYLTAIRYSMFLSKTCCIGVVSENNKIFLMLC